MLKQSLYRKLLTSALLLIPLACSQQSAASSDLQFDNTLQSLGTLWAGERVTLRFDFVNHRDSAAIISRIETKCGCLSPRVFVDGEQRNLPASVNAGESGYVEVEFDTAGFKGIKETGANIYVDGAQQPISLDVSVFLSSWFRQQPSRIVFDESDGLGEQRMTVQFTGQQPFSFSEVLSASPPLQVKLIAGEQPSLTQSVELILPPQSRQGTQTATFSLLSDHDNFRTVSMVRYSTKPPIFTVPNGKLLLGEVPAATASFAAVDIGANVGTLEVVGAVLHGIEVSSVRIQELEGAKRFRLQLSITPPSDGGAFGGELVIDLIHHFDGKTVPVSRKIQVFGVSPTTHL
ncbi:MAG: DUF1573 domain-containing protein [Planctomycetes bacterium]|jgi:hypothetical protein|nr:DUF1573 domain-containing protein [Planctomycetota bacterium]